MSEIVMVAIIPEHHVGNTTEKGFFLKHLLIHGSGVLTGFLPGCYGNKFWPLNTYMPDNA